MATRTTITTLRSIRDHLKAVADACEKIPMGADANSWVSVVPGTMVRVGDLRRMVKGYKELTREIERIKS